LRPLPVDQLAEVRVSGHGADEASARQAAALAGGRVGIALRFLADPEVIASHNELVETLFELLECSLRQRFARVEGMIKAPDQAGSRAKLRETLQAWIGVWRDALLLASGSVAPIANLAHRASIQALAESISVDRIHAHMRRLEEGLTMLDQNVNPRLLLENILLDY
ncbi:MAG TPA: DNA polymerase III subunit delta' C-terminal domain-containing protein, partial [Anaerolineaceae bacterium]|nr:DNA polymerase III subunit delta' C-terminal domain-containing protein [Anaerolineaceae bacterium]